MSGPTTFGARQGIAVGALPLAGVRVVDLGQFIAMPFCTQWLAWMGAEVIVIESRRHFTSRSSPPFVAGHDGDPDASGYVHLLYGSKKSCTIDLSTAEGRELVRRLVGLADVLVDNFSTGVVERLGLGYEAMRAVRPDLIMLSCGAFGRAGPLKDAMGFHSAVNLYSGVADVTGYAGGHGRILGGCLPDPLSGVYCVFAITAALWHRRQTGEGQYIDLAMYEAMLPCIPEAIIDFTLNGREPSRTGNRDRVNVPHGIFPCREADTWIAISIGSDREWRRLCSAAGEEEWSRDPRFGDALGRHRDVDALERLLAAWTRRHDAAALVERLQAAGVASGPVLRSDQLLDDPQLAARGVVVENEQPVGGPRRQLGLPWTMDSVGADYRRAPRLGEHTREIVSGLLGLTESEYAALEAAGVLA